MVKKNELKASFEKVASELQALQKAKIAADQKLVSGLVVDRRSSELVVLIHTDHGRDQAVL